MNLILLLNLIIIGILFFVSITISKTIFYFSDRNFIKIKDAKKIKSERSDYKIKLLFVRLNKINIIHRIYTYEMMKYGEAGLVKKQEWIFLGRIILILGTTGLAIALKTNPIGIIVVQVWIEIFLYRLRVEQRNKFSKEAYKIYKFTRNQLSSGLKVSQVLNNLPSIITDELLSSRFRLAGIQYSVSGDIDSAFDEVLKSYNTIACEGLVLSLKQIVKTGHIGLEEKEKRLFQDYIYSLKMETKKIQVQYMIIAIFHCIAIVFILMYPVLLDYLAAMDNLWG